MSIRFLLLVPAALLASLAAAQPKQPDATVKPKTVTIQKPDATLREVAAGLSNSPAGVAVAAEGAASDAKCPVAFADTPFWEALETTARKTETRISLRDGGRSVLLQPLAGKPREPSAACGPFRVVASRVTGTVLLADGEPEHTVHLDVHWEPRMPVYRIDLYPRRARATDDRGTELAIPARSAQDYPTGVQHGMTVEKLTGLTRESKKIAALAGEFRAVVAEQMLSVTFKNLAGKFPASQTVGGVKVTLNTFEKAGDTWDAEVTLEYPANHPEFESFQEQKWLRDTRLQLVAPGAKPIDPSSEDPGRPSGRVANLTYRFKVAGDPTGEGWSLLCHTPGPLREVTVPFELKNIPIP
jgi:hypothetical protein